MSFFGLVIRNLWSKKARSIGLAFAVAIAVMAVVTLDVTSSGLEHSAAAIISVGKADFTVAQKGASDTLASTIDESATRSAKEDTGCPKRYRRLGGDPADQRRTIQCSSKSVSTPVILPAFGVRVVAGDAYAPTAAHQVMLGWRAAANLGLHVGDRFNANGTWNTVVGLYSTGNAFGDAGAMFPLPAIQGYNRVPGIVTLAFVKVTPGVSITKVAAHIDYAEPELTTIRTATQFGRADQNLDLSAGCSKWKHGPRHLDRRGDHRQHHALVPF